MSKSAVRTGAARPARTGTEPIIEVHGLTKVYHVGEVDVHALRGVDLEIARGEFVAIVGASGSGKSTLFHILGGLTPPSAGTVVIDGKDLELMSNRERTDLRKTTVGFVFQKYNLLPTLSAEDNIKIVEYIGGRATKFTPEFVEVLKLLGIDDRLKHKPRALSWRAAAAGGDCARDCEPSGHPAGRRADGQPGQPELSRRAEGDEGPERAHGADDPDDYAQRGGGRVRQPVGAHPRRPDCVRAKRTERPTYGVREFSDPMASRNRFISRGKSARLEGMSATMTKVLTDRINRIEVSATMAITAEALKMKAAGIDLANFGAGEPHFNTPQHIKDAAIEAIEKNFSRYTACARHPRGAQGRCRAPRGGLRLQLRGRGVRLYLRRQAGAVQRHPGAGGPRRRGDAAGAVLGLVQGHHRVRGRQGGVCRERRARELPHYGEDDRGGDHAEDQGDHSEYAVEPLGRGGPGGGPGGDRAAGAQARGIYVLLDECYVYLDFSRASR